MRIQRAACFRYDLPLRGPLPLRGQDVTRREGLLLRLTRNDGAQAWGEAAPLPGFSRENLDEAARALRAQARRIEGMELPPRPDGLDTLLAGHAMPPSVRFACESALCFACAGGDAPARWLNPAAPAQTPVNALLTLEEAPETQAAALLEMGFASAKVKVGRGRPREEGEALRALAGALPDAFELRADANRAWGLEEAADFWRTAGGRPAYVEEPLRNPAELPKLQQATGMPYALDETLQEAAAVPLDRLRALARGAAAWVWKPTLTPGSIVRLLAAPLEAPPPLVLSAAFESGVGIAALVQLAAAHAPGVPAGLDTYRWLGADVLAAPLDTARGEWDVTAMAKAGQDPTRHLSPLDE